MTTETSVAPGEGNRLRQSTSGFLEALIPIGAILAALALAGLVIAFSGGNPLLAYRELFLGAFGSVRNLSETLVRFCPLALAALAVLVGFRASFFTIGVEGQLYMGALGTTLVCLWFADLPAAVLIPVGLLAGMVGGAVFALIAGVLKTQFGVNEVISTIMLNYIATLFLDFLLRGPIRQTGTDLHYTPVIAEAAWLPQILPGARLHLGVFIPLIMALLVYLFLWRSTAGFHVRVVGTNPTAARRAGIHVTGRLLLAVGISGALAGLAGAVEIQGVFHRLQAGLSPGYGFTAIPIALVGKTLPGLTLISALFFAALGVGATMMQLKAAVPLPLIFLVQGLVIVFVVGSEAINPRLLAVRRLFRRPPILKVPGQSEVVRD